MRKIWKEATELRRPHMECFRASPLREVPKREGGGFGGERSAEKIPEDQGVIYTKVIPSEGACL